MGERAVYGVEVEILPSCVSREVVVMGARAIFKRERWKISLSCVLSKVKVVGARMVFEGEVEVEFCSISRVEEEVVVVGARVVFEEDSGRG